MGRTKAGYRSMALDDGPGQSVWVTEGRDDSITISKEKPNRMLKIPHVTLNAKEAAALAEFIQGEPSQ